MRYIRLYLHFLQFSFSKAMEFRLDFYFRIFMDAVFYVVHFSFYKILFMHTAQLGGWTLNQVLVFMGGVFVIDAFVMTVFANNLWWLPTYINRGDLDYYLVRPVSSLFFLSVREFAANSFVNLLIAVSFWGWAMANLPEPFTFMQLALYVFLILIGALLFAMFQLLTMLVVFWTQAPYGLSDIFWGLQQFMEKPHRIYANWLRVILVTVVPFSLMASVPAEIFMNGIRWETLGNIFLVAVSTFLFVLWVWRRGLRIYSSASS